MGTNSQNLEIPAIKDIWILDIQNNLDYPGMTMKILDTASDVIDALGGNPKVGEVTQRKPSAVSNWRKFNSFPANTYVAIKAALAAIECDAPDSLWDMVEAAASEQPAEATP
jgi:hypothetical protein